MVRNIIKKPPLPWSYNLSFVQCFTEQLSHIRIYGGESRRQQRFHRVRHYRARRPWKPRWELGWLCRYIPLCATVVARKKEFGQTRRRRFAGTCNANCEDEDRLIFTHFFQTNLSSESNFRDPEHLKDRIQHHPPRQNASSRFPLQNFILFGTRSDFRRYKKGKTSTNVLTHTAAKLENVLFYFD